MRIKCEFSEVKSINKSKEQLFRRINYLVSTNGGGGGSVMKTEGE